MAENSKINWTTHTFNPWIGCTKVSPGCLHCYAETLMDTRYGRVKWGAGNPRSRTAPSNWKKVRSWNNQAVRDGIRPRVFCASLADWLDAEIPIEWLRDLLQLVQTTPNLDWLLLTKRPENWSQRVHDAFAAGWDGDEWASQWLDGHAPGNVWVGTTVEDQTRADLRMPLLAEIPARVRFLSCEPMIGPVSLANHVDWLIYAGEHPGDRPNRFFYATVPGIISESDLPEWAGWYELDGPLLALRRKAPLLHKGCHGVTILMRLARAMRHRK